MKLALDHHYPTAIADGLRSRGHHVVTLLERGWHQLDDAEVLERCSAEGLTLVTNNVADFARIARDWQQEGRSHAGLVFTSDARWPRSRKASGQLTAALDAMLHRHPADVYPGLILWLS